jgi:nicotinate-nucleotide adenylyltransferase
MQDLGTNTRVGILGGTLDPIHVGHIETALAACTALSLSRILVMPSRIPPHRTQSPTASMFHRFAMASLAVQGLDTWLVCDDELREEGPSYTALTLERLAQRGLSAGRTFFITGADAFAEIETWHRYPEVLDLAHFIVISRPGITAATALERVPGITERLRPATAGIVPPRPSIFAVDAATPDVSSTDIRRRLRAGQSISGLVAPAVEAHILRHRLYVEPQAAKISNED